MTSQMDPTPNRLAAELGQALAADVAARDAMVAAQIDAQRLTRTIGLRVNAAQALDLTLAASKSIQSDATRASLALLQPSAMVSQQMAKALSMMAGASATFAQASLRTAMVDTIASWKSVQDLVWTRVQEVLRAVDWTQALGGVLEIVAAAERREMVTAFKMAALLPAPSMPPDLVERVVELYRINCGPSAISNAVSGRYGRGDWALLEEVTSGWSSVPYLRSRRELMRQARHAMRGKMYLLVAPSLVPQIEGIAADFLRASTGSGRASHRQLSKRLAGTIPAYTASEVGLAAVDGFLRFLDEQLFATVDFEKPPPKKDTPRLNRHVLLHGRDHTQATRMNGLRAFILLDVLGSVVRHVDVQIRA